MIRVDEFDKDYHTVVNSWVMSQKEFNTRKKNGEFEDWSGYSYFIHEIDNERK